MIEGALSALRDLLSADPEVGTVRLHASGAAAGEWQGVGLRLIEVQVLPAWRMARPGRTEARLGTAPGGGPGVPVRLRVLLGVRLPDALEETRMLGRCLSAVTASPVLRAGGTPVTIRPEQGQDPGLLRAALGGPPPLCAVLGLEGPLLELRGPRPPVAPPVYRRGGPAV